MPIAYANTPVQSRAADLIDYGTLQGLKLWNLLMEGLADKFNCEEQHVLLFMEDVMQKIKASGWDHAGTDCMTILDSDRVIRNSVN
eukprot:2140477-Ditylum_brightwellii.AAC.1